MSFEIYWLYRYEVRKYENTVGLIYDDNHFAKNMGLSEVHQADPVVEYLKDPNNTYNCPQYQVREVN